MACVGRTKECTIVPSNHYGPIPGIPVGTMWRFRVQVPANTPAPWLGQQALASLAFQKLHFPGKGLLASQRGPGVAWTQAVGGVAL